MQEGESISQQGSKRLPPIVKRSYGNIDEVYDSMEGSMDMEREYGGEEYKEEVSSISFLLYELGVSGWLDWKFE